MPRQKLYYFYLASILFSCSSFLMKKLPLANQKVLEYVDSIMETKVGTGECADLIFNAQFHLKKEQIKSKTKTKKILPGDFISFKNAIFDNVNNTLKLPDHQAIIYKVISQTELIIVHQNHNNIKLVKKLHIDLNNLTQGSININHP